MIELRWLIPHSGTRVVGGPDDPKLQYRTFTNYVVDAHNNTRREWTEWFDVPTHVKATDQPGACLPAYQQAGRRQAASDGER